MEMPRIPASRQITAVVPATRMRIAGAFAAKKRTVPLFVRIYILWIKMDVPAVLQAVRMNAPAAHTPSWALSAATAAMAVIAWLEAPPRVFVFPVGNIFRVVYVRV